MRKMFSMLSEVFEFWRFEGRIRATLTSRRSTLMFGDEILQQILMNRRQERVSIFNVIMDLAVNKVFNVIRDVGIFTIRDKYFRNLDVSSFISNVRRLMNSRRKDRVESFNESL